MSIKLGQNEMHMETFDQKYVDLINVYIDIRTCKHIKTWKHEVKWIIGCYQFLTVKIIEIFYVIK